MVTSKVTNFNQDISGWDMGKVTVLTELFHTVSSFNPDIESWDTCRVSIVNSMLSNHTNIS